MRRPRAVRPGHWNLQSRLYEDRRHDYDGAKPPQIPERLTSAFRKGLDFVRKEVEDGSIPDTSHDACIVNYYPIGKKNDSFQTHLTTTTQRFSSPFRAILGGTDCPNGQQVIVFRRG